MQQGKTDDPNNPEKGTENDSEPTVKSPLPKWSKTFQGASVTDPVSVMAMMMEEMHQERIRLEEERRQDWAAERERQERERREERAAERERQERLEKLLIETAAKAGSLSRGNSPTPSFSGSSVGNDAQLITRRFNRMSKQFEEAIIALQTSLADSTSHVKLQSKLDKVKGKYEAIQSFFDDKIDFLDGDEEKDRIVYKMNLLESSYFDLKENADEFIAEGRKLEIEEGKSGSLPSGIEPPEFFGSPLKYPTWLEEFEALVGKNKKVSRFYKVKYLKGAMKGKAAGLLDSIPMQAEFYEKALEKVRERFGKNRLVVRHLVGSVLNLEEDEKMDPRSLRKMYDTMSARWNTLEKQDPTVDMVMVPILESKLPNELREEWEKKMAESIDPDECATQEQFFKFFLGQIEAKEATMEYSLEKKKIDKRVEDRSKNAKDKKTFEAKSEAVKSSAQALSIQVDDDNQTCSFCGKGHANPTCPVLKKVPVKERLYFVMEEHRDKRVCISCLGVHDRFGRCAKVCTKCGRRHHQMLHVDDGKKDSGSTSTEDNTTTQLSTTVKAVINCQADSKTKEILPTAKVRIRHNGKEQAVRVAFDSLAQKSFITRRVVDELGLIENQTGEVLEIHGFGGQITFEEAKTVQFELSSLFEDKPVRIEGAYICEKKICSPFEAVNFEIEKYPHLRGLRLADPMPRNKVDIDILLGVRHFHGVVLGGFIKSENPMTEPTAMSTVFGHVISGPYASKNEMNKCIEMHVGIRVHNHEELDAKLERFWEVESLGIGTDKRPFTEDERRALDHFEKNVKYDGERYEVSLPFRKDAIKLENNYQHAKRILESTERKLLKNPERRKEFSDAIEVYEKMGYAHELTKEELEFYRKGEQYYVPSHPVRREDSESTPTRVVFNASSKDRNGHSLNENLLAGPPVQPDLAQVLIRFRWHRYVITGDLKKMFCQIRLNQNDRRFQLYLWRDCDQSVEPRIYSMDTLIFGGTSSPFLAGSTVHKHAEQPKMVENYPRLTKEIKPNTYVDDHYNGRSSVGETIQLYHDLVGFFKSGGFKITKFATNSTEVLQHIPTEDRIASLTIELDKEEYGQARALGLDWQTEEDQLRCKVTDTLLTPANRLTKRIIASKTASVYDVFGFTAPFIIRAKIILQDLWKKDCKWDNEVDEEIAERFRNWELELPLLKEVVVPRRLMPRNFEVESISLHGFSDASEDAYGAIVYLRATSNDGLIWTNMIMAKTKVAPIKKTTIARLELMGAQCLAKLLKYVVEAFDPLEVEIEQVHGWTDSEITLDWIAQPSYKWKTFVANRVQSIHDCFPLTIWRHCPGQENPADHLTRGRTLKELKNDPNYWEGPAWLRKTPDYWPEQRRRLEPRDETIMETAAIKVRACVANEMKNDVIEELSKRYQEFKKVVRVLSWVMRWFRNLKRCKSGEQKLTGSHLSVEELNESTDFMWKEVQRKSFPKEYDELKVSGKLTDLKSPLLNWDPQFDHQRGVITSRGRLQFADIPTVTKHPIILPKKNNIVRKMIIDIHVKGHHAAKETTLALVQERYVVMSARQEVRESLHGCLICRHASTKPVDQKMGILPAERVQVAPAFTEIGLDFTGALWIKEGGTTRKCYILVCTCPATRMVHFELTNNMTTDEFIQALRRVLNRRGKCNVIHSDNQSSFKRADRVMTAAISHELEKMKNADEVKRFLVDQGITWSFITERSPFRGGYWERLNRSLKEPLKKVLGKSLLTYTEMYTVLTDIECALNQRPLTYTGTEASDPLPITPAHLAIGRSLSTFPTVPSLSPVPVGKRYRYLQKLLQHFWRRWSTEYLPRLNERRKWKTEERTLRVGDVCLITEENVSRPSWPMGRVVSTVESRDGIVRTVTLKTAKGYLTRPVQRLHLLEPNEMDSSEMQTTVEAVDIELANQQEENHFAVSEEKEVSNEDEHEDAFPPPNTSTGVIDEDETKISETGCEKGRLNIPTVDIQGGECSRSGRRLRKPDRLEYKL